MRALFLLLGCIYIACAGPTYQHVPVATYYSSPQQRIVNVPSLTLFNNATGDTLGVVRLGDTLWVAGTNEREYFVMYRNAASSVAVGTLRSPDGSSAASGDPTILTGPRGGKYHINGNGNKVYESSRRHK